MTGHVDCLIWVSRNDMFFAIDAETGLLGNAKVLSLDCCPGVVRVRNFGGTWWVLEIRVWNMLCFRRHVLFWLKPELSRWLVSPDCFFRLIITNHPDSVWFHGFLGPVCFKELLRYISEQSASDLRRQLVDGHWRHLFLLSCSWILLAMGHGLLWDCDCNIIYIYIHVHTGYTYVLYYVKPMVSLTFSRPGPIRPAQWLSQGPFFWFLRIGNLRFLETSC